MERRVIWIGAAAAALPLALAFAGLILFGFLKLSGDGVVPGTGYGYYSSNLNSLFNPMNGLLGSSILPPLPTATILQYEGYGYLGVGAMIVALVGLWLGRNREPDSFVLPLLIVAGGAFLLAISTTISAGSSVIPPIPMPVAVLKVLEIFRSSGRFIWVTYYILLGLGVTMLLRLAPMRVALAVLTLGALVQIVDLAAPYAGMRANFAARTGAAVRFKDPIYSGLGHAHTALLVIPPWQCATLSDYNKKEAFQPISILAIENRLRTNSFYSGRLPRDQERYHCVEFPQAFDHTPTDINAAYLFTPKAFAASGAQVARSHFCDLGDNFILCRADRGGTGISDRAQKAIESTKVGGNTLEKAEAGQ
jgi:hypothetical protein